MTERETFDVGVEEEEEKVDFPFSWVVSIGIDDVNVIGIDIGDKGRDVDVIGIDIGVKGSVVEVSVFTPVEVFREVGKFMVLTFFAFRCVVFFLKLCFKRNKGVSTSNFEQLVCGHGLQVVIFGFL